MFRKSSLVWYFCECFLNVENAANAVLALVIAQLEEAGPVQWHTVLHQRPDQVVLFDICNFFVLFSP